MDIKADEQQQRSAVAYPACAEVISEGQFRKLEEMAKESEELTAMQQQQRHVYTVLRQMYHIPVDGSVPLDEALFNTFVKTYLTGDRGEACQLFYALRRGAAVFKLSESELQARYRNDALPVLSGEESANAYYNLSAHDFWQPAMLAVRLLDSCISDGGKDWRERRVLMNSRIKKGLAEWLERGVDDKQYEALKAAVKLGGKRFWGGRLGLKADVMEGESAKVAVDVTRKLLFSTLAVTIEQGGKVKDREKGVDTRSQEVTLPSGGFQGGRSPPAGAGAGRVPQRGAGGAEPAGGGAAGWVHDSGRRGGPAGGRGGHWEVDGHRHSSHNIHNSIPRVSICDYTAATFLFCSAPCVQDSCGCEPKLGHACEIPSVD